ncbi:OsmC family peroxiredoxin [Mycobacterium sp.]|uniref:OsmC family peroxiredoxin n=1 Tax=unclassified Mycobacterium TaxID=2642494 RepID=UPI0031E2188A
MSIAERTTQTIWEGPLVSGGGTLAHGSSGVLDGVPLTWASRTEQPDGKSSPEELAAAAHSSCFAMALAMKLDENHTPPARLDVTATVSLDAVDGVPTITASRLKVRARVDLPAQSHAELLRFISTGRAPDGWVCQQAVVAGTQSNSTTH